MSECCSHDHDNQAVELSIVILVDDDGSKSCGQQQTSCSRPTTPTCPKSPTPSCCCQKPVTPCGSRPTTPQNGPGPSSSAHSCCSHSSSHNNNKVVIPICVGKPVCQSQSASHECRSQSANREWQSQSVINPPRILPTGQCCCASLMNTCQQRSVGSAGPGASLPSRTKSQTAACQTVAQVSCPVGVQSFPCQKPCKKGVASTPEKKPCQKKKTCQKKTASKSAICQTQTQTMAPMPTVCCDAPPPPCAPPPKPVCAKPMERPASKGRKEKAKASPRTSRKREQKQREKSEERRERTRKEKRPQSEERRMAPSEDERKAPSEERRKGPSEERRKAPSEERRKAPSEERRRGPSERRKAPSEERGKETPPEARKAKASLVPPEELNFTQFPSVQLTFVDYFLKAEGGVMRVINLAEAKHKFEKKCKAELAKMSQNDRSKAEKFFMKVMETIQVKPPDSNNTEVKHYQLQKYVAPILTELKIDAEQELRSIHKYHKYILSVVMYMENLLKQRQTINPDALVDIETHLLAGIVSRFYPVFIKVKDLLKSLSLKRGVQDIPPQDFLKQIRKLILTIYVEIMAIDVTFTNTLTSLSYLPSVEVQERYRKQLVLRKSHARHSVTWAARCIATSLLYYYIQSGSSYY